MTRAYVVTRVVLRSCILCGEPEWDTTGGHKQTRNQEVLSR